MGLKDLWVRIGDTEISSKDMTKLSLECGKTVVEYDEPNTPEGVSEFFRLVCRPNEVEFICPYEVSKDYRDITGGVTKTTFCTKECPYDTWDNVNGGVRMEDKIFRALWRYKWIRPLLWRWSPSLGHHAYMEEWGQAFLKGFNNALEAGGHKWHRRSWKSYQNH